MICDEKAALRDMCYEKKNGKRLGIDTENRLFDIEVTFPNLRHPQLFIKDVFSELKDGNFFGILQTILQTCFIVAKCQSCSPSINNAKKHEHKGDVKRRCLLLKHSPALS